MRKNVASQFVAFQAVSTTDGSAVTTGTPAVYYTIDGGVEGTGGGACVHEGHGTWSYACAQAETNGNHVVFTFVLTGAVSQAVNVYPVGYDETAALATPTNITSATGITLTPTTGLGNQTANITGTVSGNSTHSAADVKTAIEAAGSHLTLILEDTGTTLPSTLSTILTDTDELQKAITDGGRTDLLIDAIKAKTDAMLDAAATRTAVGLASANLDTQLSGINSKTTNLPSDPADQSAVEAAIAAVQSHGDSTWATATSVMVSDKAGFKLASDGLDSVATTAPTGPAANFREMIVQTWRRFFKRSTRTYSGGTQQIVTYADNGTTPVTTQTISDDGTTETQGVAS